MTEEELLIEQIYHCIQHIKTDLDDITTDRIKSIDHTINHILKNIELHYDKKDNLIKSKEKTK
jgi:hypothetical protein